MVAIESRRTHAGLANICVHLVKAYAQNPGNTYFCAHLVGYVRANAGEWGCACWCQTGKGVTEP